MTKAVISVLCAAVVVSGCATQPDQVQRSYIFPVAYSGYSCTQLTAERAAIVMHVQELTAHQRKKANTDAAAMAVGMVLFWPALFALSAGNDFEAELSVAKGKHDAIETAGRMQGCFTGADWAASSGAGAPVPVQPVARGSGFPPL